jgi:hypothetical protein
VGGAPPSLSASDLVIHELHSATLTVREPMALPQPPPRRSRWRPRVRPAQSRRYQPSPTPSDGKNCDSRQKPLLEYHPSTATLVWGDAAPSRLSSSSKAVRRRSYGLLLSTNPLKRFARRKPTTPTRAQVGSSKPQNTSSLQGWVCAVAE